VHRQTSGRANKSLRRWPGKFAVVCGSQLQQLIFYHSYQFFWKSNELYVTYFNVHSIRWVIETARNCSLKTLRERTTLETGVVTSATIVTVQNGHQQRHLVNTEMDWRVQKKKKKKKKRGISWPAKRLSTFQDLCSTELVNRRKWPTENRTTLSKEYKMLSSTDVWMYWEKRSSSDSLCV